MLLHFYCGEQGRTPPNRTAVECLAHRPSLDNLIFVWNEFIFALTLTASSADATLPVGLRQLFGQFGVHVPAVMMALTAASLPILIFYLYAQERVIQGLTAGAGK